MFYFKLYKYGGEQSVLTPGTKITTWIYMYMYTNTNVYLIPNKYDINKYHIISYLHSWENSLLPFTKLFIVYYHSQNYL